MQGYIYRLVFKNTNKVYIGQTIDITRRLRTHINLMRKNKAAKKMQEAYNLFGEPSIEIISGAIDNQKDLDAAEDEAIEIFNSVENGFNTQDKSRAGHTACYGELNGNSKFSNQEVLELVDLLIDNPSIRLREAAEIFGMSYVTVDEICRGVKHKWIGKAYPDKHAKLLSIVGTRSKAVTAEDLGITYPPIYSPTGIKYEVKALRAFAREHGLNNTCLSKVLRGEQSHHKGWKILPPTL
jgi:predicted GIY-YIG superfamily endonuclease/transposase